MRDAHKMTGYGILFRQTALNICHGVNRFVIGCERELVDSLVTEIQQVHAERGMKCGGSRLVVG